jgi:excisionase family DNA binding protein
MQDHNTTPNSFEMNEIKSALNSDISQVDAEYDKAEADELLTVQDAAKFLSISVTTIYFLIWKDRLPVLKRSKRYYFSKVDLINYLKQGRRKTSAEISAESDEYLTKKKRG